MPDYQNHPARVGRMQSLASVIGRDTTGHAKRPTLVGNYVEPRHSFAQRMKWLAMVQRLIAECSAKHESYPHKLAAVARALAYVGDVCKPSIDYVAAQAGCVANTVKACLEWLEVHGALTWSHTVRKHKNGRIVRSSNLYRFILDFGSFAAQIARAVRASWRERRKLVPGSKGNGCPGETQYSTYIERHEAQRRLAAIAKQRSEEFDRQWLAARTV
jgi:hypothetical protein